MNKDIEKLRLGCLVMVCDRRESGMVGSACVHYRAFSQEPPPEVKSRDGRMTALTVCSVLALKSCA